MNEIQFSQQHFLEAQKSVLDRALNQNVWNQLKTELFGAGGQSPVCVLELEAGVGGMLTRLAAQGVLSRAAYHLVDGSKKNIEFARENLPTRLEAAGLEVLARPGGLFVYSQVCALDLVMETGTVDQWIDRESGRTQWDVIILSQAGKYLSRRSALPDLCNLAFPGALLYLPGVYNGSAAFEPLLDPELDSWLAGLAFQPDASYPAASRSKDFLEGRRFLTRLTDAGLNLLESGGSDWVIYPRFGRYNGDEGYLLLHLLQNIEQAVLNGGMPQRGAVQNWLSVRRTQVHQGKLALTAHHLDFLAQVSA